MTLITQKVRTQTLNNKCKFKMFLYSYKLSYSGLGLGGQLVRSCEGGGGGSAGHIDRKCLGQLQYNPTKVLHRCVTRTVFAAYLCSGVLSLYQGAETGPAAVQRDVRQKMHVHGLSQCVGMSGCSNVSAADLCSLRC
jgi:hypothetical protein